MSRLYMLDTNTVSYILNRKSPAARAKLAALHFNQIACISSITEGELRFGVANKPNQETLGPLLDQFLSKIGVLSWGREEARAYGIVRKRQEAAGRPLGNLDMLIAAHAVAVGAVLVTNDKAFRHVPDLAGTVNWATDLPRH
jgi:tRNA(fMet)-specific endonuclease VapC